MNQTGCQTPVTFIPVRDVIMLTNITIRLQLVRAIIALLTADESLPPADSHMLTPKDGIKTNSIETLAYPIDLRIPLC
jgi:hypothetical protein